MANIFDYFNRLVDAVLPDEDMKLINEDQKAVAEKAATERESAAITSTVSASTSFSGIFKLIAEFFSNLLN